MGAEDASHGLDVPLPRERSDLYGHERAEAEVLASFATGRFHHAWLIGGPTGIGKATLAYRIGRFLLAQGQGGRDPPRSLDVASDHPVSRQVAALSHPGLLVLDPALGEKGPGRSISVKAVRRVVSFFGSTASDGGYRVCIIDSVDDLTSEAANALLKAVEEPPERAAFLLVSHNPHAIMATIRSRCRRLGLRPLPDDAVRRVLLGGGVPDDKVLQRAVALAEGSPGRAIDMLDPGKQDLVGEAEGLLESLPAFDPRRVMRLADKMQVGRGDEAYELVLDAIRRWLASEVDARAGSSTPALLGLAEASARMEDKAASADTYNLDRRPLLLSIFEDLSGALRQAA